MTCGGALPKRAWSLVGDQNGGSLKVGVICLPLKERNYPLMSPTLPEGRSISADAGQIDSNARALNRLCFLCPIVD